MEDTLSPDSKARSNILFRPLVTVSATAENNDPTSFEKGEPCICILPLVPTIIDDCRITRGSARNRFYEWRYVFSLVENCSRKKGTEIIPVIGFGMQERELCMQKKAQRVTEWLMYLLLTCILLLNNKHVTRNIIFNDLQTPACSSILQRNSTRDIY